MSGVIFANANNLSGFDRLTIEGDWLHISSFV
jgi:hypothetical protein